MSIGGGPSQRKFTPQGPGSSKGGKNLLRLRTQMAEMLSEGRNMPPPAQKNQLLLARHLCTRYVPTQKPFSSLSCAKYLTADHVEALATIFSVYDVLGDGSVPSPFSLLGSQNVAEDDVDSPLMSPREVGRGRGATRLRNTGQLPQLSSATTQFAPGDHAICREWFVEVLLCVIASQLDVCIGINAPRVSSLSGAGDAPSDKVGEKNEGQVETPEMDEGWLGRTETTHDETPGTISSLGPHAEGAFEAPLVGRTSVTPSEGGRLVSPATLSEGRPFSKDKKRANSKIPALHQSFKAPGVVEPTGHEKSHTGHPSDQTRQYKSSSRRTKVSSKDSGPGDSDSGEAETPLDRIELSSAGSTSTSAGGLDQWRKSSVQEARRRAKEVELMHCREELLDWLNPICHRLESHQLPQVFDSCDLQVKLLERFHAAVRQSLQRLKQGEELFTSTLGLSKANNQGVTDIHKKAQNDQVKNNETPAKAQLKNSNVLSRKQGSKSGDSARENKSKSDLKGEKKMGRSAQDQSSGNHVSASTSLAPRNELTMNSVQTTEGLLNTIISHLDPLMQESLVIKEFLHTFSMFIEPLVGNRYEEIQLEQLTSMFFFGDSIDGKSSGLCWSEILRFPDRINALLQIHKLNPVKYPKGKRRKGCENHYIVCWSDLSNNLIMDFEQNRLVSNLDISYTRVLTRMLEEDNKGEAIIKSSVATVPDGDEDEGQEEEENCGGGFSTFGRRGNTNSRKAVLDNEDFSVKSDLETFSQELKGLHTQSADKVLISTAQPTIITSSKDGLIKLWEPRWGQFTSNLLNVGRAWVLGMWLIHNDQYMLVATSNAELTILEFPKGYIIQKFRGCSTLITALREVPQMTTALINRFGLRPGECGPHRTDYKKDMSSEEYRTLFREAQITTDRVYHPCKPIDGYVTPSAVFFEPSNGMFFFGTIQGSVGCFDLSHDVKQSILLSGANMNPLHLNSSVQAHEHGIRVVGLLYYAAGRYVISAGSDGSIVRINFSRDLEQRRGGTIILTNPHTLAVTPHVTRTMEYCLLHRVFVTTHSDRRILVWSLGRHTADLIHQFPQETQDIIAIGFISHKKQIAVLTADRFIRLFDFRGYRPLTVIVPFGIGENNAEDISSVTLKCSREDQDGCIAFLPDSDRLVCALRGPVMYEPAKIPVNSSGQDMERKNSIGSMLPTTQAVSAIPTHIVTTASVKAGLPLLPEDSDEEKVESSSSSESESTSSIDSQMQKRREEKEQRKREIKAEVAAKRLGKRRLRPNTTLPQAVVGLVIHRDTGVLHTFSPKLWKMWDLLTGRLLKIVNIREQIRFEIPLFKSTLLTSCWWTNDGKARLLAGAQDGVAVTLDAVQGRVIEVEKLMSEARVKGEPLDRDVSIIFHVKNRTIICAGRSIIVRRYSPGVLLGNGEEAYTSIVLRIPVQTTICACCLVRDSHMCVGTVETKLYFFRLIDQSVPYHEEDLSKVGLLTSSVAGEEVELSSVSDLEIGSVVGLAFVDEYNQNLLFAILDTGTIVVYSTLRGCILTHFMALKTHTCRISSFSYIRNENLFLIGTTIGTVMVFDVSKCSSADVDFKNVIRVTHCFRAATCEILNIEFYKPPLHKTEKRVSSSTPVVGRSSTGNAQEGSGTLMPEPQLRASLTCNSSSAFRKALVDESQGSLVLSPPPCVGGTKKAAKLSRSSQLSFLIVGGVDGNVRIFSMDPVAETELSCQDYPLYFSTAQGPTLGAAHPEHISCQVSKSIQGAASCSVIRTGSPGGQNLPSTQRINGHAMDTARTMHSSRSASVLSTRSTAFETLTAAPYAECFGGVASSCSTVGLLGFDMWFLTQRESFASNVLPPFAPTAGHFENEAFLNRMLKEGKMHLVAAQNAAYSCKESFSDLRGNSLNTAAVDRNGVIAMDSGHGSEEANSGYESLIASGLNTGRSSQNRTSSQSTGKNNKKRVSPASKSHHDALKHATDVAEKARKNRVQRNAPKKGSLNEKKAFLSDLADEDEVDSDEGGEQFLEMPPPSRSKDLSFMLPSSRSGTGIVPREEEEPPVFVCSLGPQRSLKESKFKRNPLIRTYPLKWLRKIRMMPEVERLLEDAPDALEDGQIDAAIAFNGMNVNENVILASMKNLQMNAAAKQKNGNDHPLTCSKSAGSQFFPSPPFVAGGIGESVTGNVDAPAAHAESEESKNINSQEQSSSYLLSANDLKSSVLTDGVSPVFLTSTTSRAVYSSTQTLPPPQTIDEIPVPPSIPFASSREAPEENSSSLLPSLAGSSVIASSSTPPSLPTKAKDADGSTKISKLYSRDGARSQRRFLFAGEAAPTLSLDGPASNRQLDGSTVPIGGGKSLLTTSDSSEVKADPPFTKLHSYQKAVLSRPGTQSVVGSFTPEASVVGGAPGILGLTADSAQRIALVTFNNSTPLPASGGVSSQNFNLYDTLRQIPKDVLEQRRDQLMLAYMAQRLDKVHPHGHDRHEFEEDVKRVWVRRAGEAQIVAETRAAALAASYSINSDASRINARHTGMAQLTNQINQELQKSVTDQGVELNLHLLTIPTEAQSAQETNIQLSARERLKAQLLVMQKQREKEVAERHHREETNPNPCDRRYWLPMISSKQPTHPVRISLPSTLQNDEGAKHQLKQLQKLILSTNPTFSSESKLD